MIVTSGSGEDGVEGVPAVSDAPLVKRAIEVRDKLQDDNYSWIMQCLQLIFEYFNEKGPRDVEIEKLTDVALKFCFQQLEHKRANNVFERACLVINKGRLTKKGAKGLDFVKEYGKLMEQEPEVTNADAKKHPKFIKFMDRVNELERGKELCKTEEISVE